MPRNFAMQMGCNWPTAVSDQFKGSFPGSAILHIRALRDETRRARAVVMNRGTTHTPRNGRCVCILRLQFRIGLLIHSRAELRSRVAIPFHDSPRVSRLISLLNPPAVDRKWKLTAHLFSRSPRRESPFLPDTWRFNVEENVWGWIDFPLSPRLRLTKDSFSSDLEKKEIGKVFNYNLSALFLL